MKHRLQIPYADSAIPDLPAWLHQCGWRVSGVSMSHDALHWPRPKYFVSLESWADAPATMTVASGAVLVWDDEERSLGVTGKMPAPEPEDAIPPQPQDDPAWRND